jgi:lipoprotein-releasing system permease protein
MSNALALQIAFRYLYSKKSTNAINIITAVAMIGMAVGAMALILVLSVFNGFEGLVLSLYNQFTPDLQLTPLKGKVFNLSQQQLDKLRGVDGVAAMATILEEKAMLKYQDREYIATVKGIDADYLKVNNIKATVVDGRFLLNDDSGIDYMVLGAGVRAALGANVNDGINAISVFLPRRGKQARGLLPTDAFNRRFVFASGVFSIQQEYDYEYTYVPISFLREALKYDDEISSVAFKLNADANANQVKQAIEVIVGKKFILKNRYEQDEALFKVMNTERIVAYGIFAFVILIIAFNITGALSMIVLEKAKDIAVLKTMGATRQWITSIFLLEGILISMIGTLSGIALAIIIGYIQIYFEPIKMNTATMVVDAYPIVFKAESFVVVLLMVLCIGTLASIIPALRAGNSQMQLKGK